MSIMRLHLGFNFVTERSGPFLIDNLWFVLISENDFSNLFLTSCLEFKGEHRGPVLPVVGGMVVCVTGLTVVLIVVVGLVVVETTTGGRLVFVKVALNPFEVLASSDLKRTTIVFLLDSSGLGGDIPQIFPSYRKSSFKGDNVHTMSFLKNWNMDCAVTTY